MRISGRRLYIILFIGIVLVIWLVANAGSPAIDSGELPDINEPVLVPTSAPERAPTLNESTTPTIIPTLRPTAVNQSFDGKIAFQYLVDQMTFGPRWPGSQGHQDVGDYIVSTLMELGWQVEEQTFRYRDEVGRNIIGRHDKDGAPVIIIGAHYDTRKIADKTPGSTSPVPGAVDGASGVAVLLELARSLNMDNVDSSIWLAFFDLEDQGSGGMPGYEWIVGSTFMANNLTTVPEAMILVDMVGDADQQLYFEGNSDPSLQYQLWQHAQILGYGDYFISEYRHTLIDDHLPFARKGIPAIDIIDFDYPYWHTVEDTLDKASPESLERVGRTVEFWLEGKQEFK